MPDTMAGGAPWPKVSVVTPSYNQAGTIEETIRSVLLQGYPNLEYLIMDGGSTDSSVEIIRQYAPWLAGWVSEPDNGQSHAINKGWQRAGGEIVAWLNSDDTYEPDALRAAVEYLAAHPEVDLVYGDCNMIDEQGAALGLCPAKPFDLRTLVRTEWLIPQQSVFIRRRVLDAVGYLNQDLHMVMDLELWLRIALAGFQIAYTPGLWANFRIYGQAKTSRYFERSAAEKLDVLNKVFVRAKQAGRVRALKRPAYSYVHRFLGIHYYWASEMNKARCHLGQSIGLAPLERLRDGEAVKRFLLACLGRTGVRALRRLKGIA